MGNEIKEIETELNCYYCGDPLEGEDLESPFMDDDNEVMCYNCYSEHFEETCPICEEHYYTKDFCSDFFVLAEELAKEVNKIPGIYHVKERPFFYGDVITGFDNFNDDAIELVLKIKINVYKKTDCGDYCQEVGTGLICPDCINKFVRDKSYIKSNSIPCILMKKYENDSFYKDYSKEQLSLIRRKTIHERITCRGMVERGKIKDVNYSELIRGVFDE